MHAQIYLQADTSPWISIHTHTNSQCAFLGGLSFRVRTAKLHSMGTAQGLTVTDSKSAFFFSVKYSLEHRSVSVCIRHSKYDLFGLIIHKSSEKSIFIFHKLNINHKLIGLTVSFNNMHQPNCVSLSESNSLYCIPNFFKQKTCNCDLISPETLGQLHKHSHYVKTVS